MVKLTISIVNYNGGEYLKRCLESVKKVRGEADITTIVVDNASSDKSTENIAKLFDVKVIVNKENVGFGKANNQVLKAVKSEYVLILNPDCELNSGVLEGMIKIFEQDETVGAASCKIVLGDGTIDLTAHRGFPTPLASFFYYILKNDYFYHLKNRDMRKNHEVDAIAGAFFMTKKSILEKVGLFDEDYFLYGEDIDLCYRIKRAGFKVLYVPNLEVVHHKGISSGLKEHSQKQSLASDETRGRAFDAFYESMKIFYKKHYEKIYPFFITWLVYLGINLKWWLAKRKLTV